MLRSLALALALAALAPAPARGTGTEPDVVGSEEPPPTAGASEPAPEEGGEEADSNETWLDVSHAFIERRLFAPVVRVDRFFSDERDLEAERSRSFIRWRNELRLEEGGELRYAASLSATLRVPGIRKQLRRLRIEITGQTRDAMSALFPGEEDEDEEPASEIGSADAGLALRLWDTLQAHASLGAGILVQLPPGAYGRLRLRTALPLGSGFLSREALTGFWRTDTGFGTSASGEIERPLSPTAVARVFGTGTITEESRGLEWTGDIAVLATFRQRYGVQVGAGVNGVTDPLPGTAGVERYRVYTRLRRDFYRRWIFVELEPEYAWPWTPERGRHAAWGVAFRLEVQFHGTEAAAAHPSRRLEGPPEEPGRAGATMGSTRGR